MCGKRVKSCRRTHLRNSTYPAKCEYLTQKLSSSSLKYAVLPWPGRRFPFRPTFSGWQRTLKHKSCCTAPSSCLVTAQVVLDKDIHKRRQAIAKKYLIVLPKHGTVVLQSYKNEFASAVEALKAEVREFQSLMKDRIQSVVEENREKLVRALRAGVVVNPPDRWRPVLGSKPREQDIEQMLRSELTKAFGSAEDLFSEMKVNVVFKGVTFESLNDPEFISAVEKIIPSTLEPLHEEFDAAAARMISTKSIS